jgi:DNA-3-methyladenine glycosylase II
MTSRFTIAVRGPFSLEAVRQLQCGFLRGSRACSTDPNVVRLAFPRDGSHDVVGVTLHHDGANVRGDVVGASDGEAVGEQVARALALDHDGTAFARLLEKDPALRRAAEARPGFRPVVSYSPYVFAGWAVLSQRMRMAQAAAIQVRLAEAVGDTVILDGEPVASFPRPQSLLRLSGFAGIHDEKWRRLQAIATAALDGTLAVDALLGVPREEARARLLAIRGVGPWSAEGILVRGCGTVDDLPLGEPTLHEAVAALYDLPVVPDDAQVERIAESWRPFRTWVSVLVISYAYREKGSLSASRPRGARKAAGRPRGPRKGPGPQRS